MSSAPWLQIQVELEGNAELDCDPPPGRILVAGPGHTFLQLATAIDDAFARWDTAHLHVFELADGRLIGLPDAVALPPDSGRPRWLDHRAAELLDVLAPGDRFAYVFDLSEGWRHRCEVLAETVDPLEAFGARPERPAIVFGWGWIPDQYGRTAPGDAPL